MRMSFSVRKAKMRRSSRLNQENQGGQSTPETADVEKSISDQQPKIDQSILEIRSDNKTCLAYDERCMLHKRLDQTDHPERPERIKRIFDKLTEDGLVDRCVRLQSRTATLDEISLVHEGKYLEEFSKTKQMSTEELRTWQEKWNSIYACSDTYDASLLACGNLLECVDAVVEGRTLNGAAIIRPPGHHAESNEAYGFCFVNNVAVAAQYARKMLGVEKILILDWDVHHGNGVQSAFWTDPSVLYISIHRYDYGRFFPCNEQNNFTDVGDGAGRGFNINIPWNARGVGDAEYLEAFKKIVMPVAFEFNPDLVLVSAGFDAARGDPLGGYRVTPYGYARMTSMLSDLAHGRLILALEGGYNLTSISESMAACVRILLNKETSIEEDESPKKCMESCRKTIDEVVDFIKEFWSSLREEEDIAIVLAGQIDIDVKNAEIESLIVEAQITVDAIEKLTSDVEDQLRIDTKGKSISDQSISDQSISESKTGLIYEDVVSSKHYCPWDSNHIETPSRLTTSLKKIADRGLIDRCLILESRRADVSEICNYHDMNLVEQLSETPNWDESKLESLSGKFDDVYVNENTYESALIAAGSTIDGVKSILDNRCRNSMVLVRPPGHHAMTAAINGFCIFNNVVLATKMALDDYKLKRILIVDWDVHHGQGTQRAFYDDPRVLYFSIHRYEHGAFWPNLRESDWDFTGSESGTGYNVNVPLNKIGMGDAEFLSIFHHVLLPLAVDFDPELVIVSAGYDAAIGCPEGRMEVSPLCYGHLTRMLMSLAGGRVCVVLEGGYCLDSLAEGVAMTLRSLLGDYCPKLPSSISKPIDVSLIEVLLNSADRLKSEWKSMKDLCFLVNVVLMKLERTPYAGSTPIYDWTPVERQVYATRNKYPYRPTEIIEKFRTIVEKMMADCRLEKTKSKLSLGCDEKFDRKSILEQLKEENGGQGLGFVDEKRESVEADLDIICGGSGYCQRMKKFSSIEGQSKSTFEESVSLFGLILNAVETMQKRDTQCAMVLVGKKSSVDPIFDAIRYAQLKLGLKKILIIDFCDRLRDDIFQVFYGDKTVLCFNVRGNDSSGEFGRPENVGRGAGAGYNVNLILNEKWASDSDYLFALHHIILPMAYSFDPDLVVAFGGNHSSDQGRASSSFYAYFAHQMQSLAEGKLLLVMKDSDTDAIDSTVLACAKTLLQTSIPQQLQLNSATSVSPNTIVSLAETVFHLRPYWPYLQCMLAPNPNVGSGSSAGRATNSNANAGAVAEFLHLPDQLGHIGSMYSVVPSTNCPHANVSDESVCATVPEADELKMDAPCDNCGNVGENWICLTCWKIFCGRYVNEHAMLHSIDSGHPIALSMADLSVWCYKCDTYIQNDNVVKAKRVLHKAKFGVDMPS